MPITPTYPGIYIQELPSTAHTITAAPTSIAVFVGYTHPFKTNWDPDPSGSGTTNSHGPVEIFSFSDYEREFGGACQSGFIDSNVANAVNQFFLNGGADAFVVGIKPTYTNKRGNGNDDSAVNLITPIAVDAATFEFGASPNGIVFTAREPIDKTDMKITISNPQPVASPTAADIVVSYGSLSETYRRVSLDSSSPDFIEKRIGTAAPTATNSQGGPISSLVTVSADTAYPAAYPFPAGQTAMTPTTTTSNLPSSGSNVVGIFESGRFRPGLSRQTVHSTSSRSSISWRFLGL